MWTCGDSSDMHPTWRCTWLGAESARRIFPLTANVRPFISRSLVTTCDNLSGFNFCETMQTYANYLDTSRLASSDSPLSFMFLLFSKQCSHSFFLSRKARKTIAQQICPKMGRSQRLQKMSTAWALPGRWAGVKRESSLLTGKLR